MLTYKVPVLSHHHAQDISLNMAGQKNRIRIRWMMGAD
jgi:hypothetical protein